MTILFYITDTSSNEGQSKEVKEIITSVASNGQSGQIMDATIEIN